MTDPRLVQALQELDPGTRALLDLSLRRAVPDERVAGLLGVELAEIPRRRARGIAELADKLEVPGPSELAMLLVALPDLPEEAWGVPSPKLPKAKKVSAAKRAKAFRRAAVAASPLVAAAAVLAAVIVSSGGGGNKSASLTLQGGRVASGGKQHSAAVAKAPLKADARHALPRGAEVASAEGPSPATLTARKAAARHRRERARHKSQAPLVNTVPVAEHFATSAPQPDAFVPQPKPKHKHKPQAKPKEPTPDTPPTTTTPAPVEPTPQVVASPPTQQVTTTTPVVTPPKQDATKKPPIQIQQPVVQPPPQSSDDDSNNGGGGCGHGGDRKWGGDHKSSVFKTRREVSRQRSGWPSD